MIEAPTATDCPSAADLCREFGARGGYFRFADADDTALLYPMCPTADAIVYFATHAKHMKERAEMIYFLCLADLNGRN